MEKFYNLEKEVIKCVVYQFGGELKEIEKDFLRKKIKSSAFVDFIVTFTFKFIELSKASESSISNQVPIYWPIKAITTNFLKPIRKVFHSDFLTSMLRPKASRMSDRHDDSPDLLRKNRGYFLPYWRLHIKGSIGYWRVRIFLGGGQVKQYTKL